MLPILTDTKEQRYIQWQQADITGRGFKRAWIIRHPPEKDWAGTGRYLNVARIDINRPGSGGNPTDFPIFNNALSDDQVLEAFVASVCAITGCRLPDSN
jgi:hypothetical protein